MEAKAFRVSGDLTIGETTVSSVLSAGIQLMVYLKIEDRTYICLLWSDRGTGESKQEKELSLFL